MVAVLPDAEPARFVVRNWVHLAWLVALVLFLPVAFLLGEQRVRSDDSATLSGTAYVGQDQATVMVGGWAYGFTPSETPWFEADGDSHEGDAAPCLRRIGARVPITFGEVTAHTPGGGSYRAVTWVRCR